MFVRDKDSVQGTNIFANGGEAFGDFSAAQTGIDEKPSTIRGKKRRIATATRGQDADLEDGILPLSLYSSDKPGGVKQKMEICFPHVFLK